MHRAYGQSTRIFAGAVCALGIVMIVVALANGGGPLAFGVVLGVAFVVIGAGRLYLAGDR